MSLRSFIEWSLSIIVVGSLAIWMALASNHPKPWTVPEPTPRYTWTTTPSPWISP